MTPVSDFTIFRDLRNNSRIKFTCLISRTHNYNLGANIDRQHLSYC